MQRLNLAFIALSLLAQLVQLRAAENEDLCTDDSCLADGDRSSMLQTKVSPAIEEKIEEKRDVGDDAKDVSLPATAALNNALTTGAGLEGSSGKPEDLAAKIKALNDAAAEQSPHDAEDNNDLITGSAFSQLVGQHAEDEGCKGDKKSCFQGDMEAASAEQMALFQQHASTGSGKNAAKLAAGKPWTNNKVKYCLAADLDQEIHHLWDLSVEQLKKAAVGLTFEDVGNQGGHKSDDDDTSKECDSAPAIFVQSSTNEGCWSYIGELTPPIRTSKGMLKTQLLNLHPTGCALLGISIHELLHAMGMAHEQSRPDREQYVTIHWENIQAGNENNFQIESAASTAETYDFTSIMHYDTDSFSINGQPTITTKDGHHDSTLGQRTGLSQYDADQLGAMYGLTPSQIDAQTGCHDKDSSCAGLTACSTHEHMNKCCGCGGGTEYRCWANTTCHVRQHLPVTDHKACIEDRTSWFGGRYACVTENTCDYTVRVECSDTSSYWNYKPGGCCQLPPWGSEVCGSDCKVSKV